MATPISVEALVPGDHACLTFSDPDERLDLVAAFVRDGISGYAKVVCLTEALRPEQLEMELADRGVPVGDDLNPGQLTVSGSEGPWLVGGPLTAAKLIDRLSGLVDEASREGYAGLRFTADMCWVTRPGAAADQLPLFEREVSKLFADGRLTAICQYDRDTFDAVTLAVAAETHTRAVAATVYHDDAVLRICRQHSPPGLRVSGEIDFTRVEPLTVGLAEALRLDRDFQVNLARLRFIDAAAAGAILQAALAVPAGRTMTVVCAGPVRRTLALLGAGDIATVRLVGVRGDA
jgi:anti-anti-sigma regulatory factor